MVEWCRVGRHVHRLSTIVGIPMCDVSPQYCTVGLLWVCWDKLLAICLMRKTVIKITTIDLETLRDVAVWPGVWSPRCRTGCDCRRARGLFWVRPPQPNLNRPTTVKNSLSIGSPPADSSKVILRRSTPAGSSIVMGGPGGSTVCGLWNAELILAAVTSSAVLKFLLDLHMWSMS